MIQKLFKDCKTYASYNNATIGLNLYTIPDIENFAIIDSPGDTENVDYLELFAKKGYAYSKLLIYVLDERKNIDADSMRNNTKLKTLIELKLEYKIPLLILLTHFDNYCDEIKKTATDDSWKETCEDTLNKNKDDLFDFINKDIIKNKEYELDENDILHIVLVEPKKITDEDLIKTFDENTKKEYENSSGEEKAKMIKNIRLGMNLKDNEVQDFLKQMKILGPKELIEKLREKFPRQYHNALLEFK